MQRVTAACLASGVVMAAQLNGARFNPGPGHPRTAAWYARLRKPGFTPPGPVFGLAWTGLDALLAYAGYRLLQAPAGQARGVALGAWALNVLGVGGFSWVLFGQRRLGAALGVSAGMVATAAGVSVAAARVDKRATYATLPLLGWVLFATVLQEEVWRRNER